ncbi:MAG: polysaccharide deacetylase family protein [Ferruginibacter sp.]
MLLIYSHTVSKRLQYICSFIFKELLGMDFKLTIDSEKFRSHEGPKINYSDSKITVDEFYIQNHLLLFEQNIKKQQVDCFTVNNNKVFFKTTNSDLPFDIFAASFYLLSRYEEYLPHEKDMYGRFDCERSLAYREGFLNLPLINIWVIDLAEKLKTKYSTLHFQFSLFKFLPTYDIDIAYSYKHKGLLRNIGGYLKMPSAERIKVLTGAQQDPFDSYDWLHHLHQHYDLQPVYFFLVAERNGTYDKNILPHKDSMWKLVKQHSKKYTIGLHPSWQSGDNRALLKKEKQQLEAMIQDEKIVQVAGSVPTLITRSRQHYIRFNLPEGYQRLITAGITDDYSMGYGSINGFRASVASSFYWYNLEKDEQTVLRIHPFCFMDANSFYEQRQDTQQTWEELQHYLTVCTEVGGTLISIWHNNFLGTADPFEGWREIYDKFIAQVQQ